MLLKCCTQYVSKFGKLSIGHRNGKGQFFFQSLRRTIPKNVQTMVPLPSFHMLARLCSKSFKLGISNVNRKLPHVQAGFRKGRGTRDQIANICWIIEKAREFHKNIYFCFIDYTNAFGWFSAIMVSVCLPSDALWQHLPSYLGFSYLGRGVSPHDHPS